LVVILAIVAGTIYLSRPMRPVPEGPASAEAKAYLRNLELSNVTMKAAENFMKQQVVDLEGTIENKGPRTLTSVEVYCVFSGLDGKPIYQEKASIVPPKGPPLRSGQTRHFRLPFDTLPDGWNQALPRMIIAQINFGQ
jgi:hypothetical protein